MRRGKIPLALKKNNKLQTHIERKWYSLLYVFMYAWHWAGSSSLGMELKLKMIKRPLSRNVYWHCHLTKSFVRRFW